jgi:hypothetical protein
MQRTLLRCAPPTTAIRCRSSREVEKDRLTCGWKRQSVSGRPASNKRPIDPSVFQPSLPDSLPVARSLNIRDYPHFSVNCAIPDTVIDRTFVGPADCIEMDDALESPKRPIEIATCGVLEEGRRIAWQRELVASLKEDGHWDIARRAQTVLDQMIQLSKCSED